MAIFNKAMHRKWKRRVYVDLLAGTGRCALQSGQEFDGSPLLGIKCQPPFSCVVAVDRAGNLLDALRHRVRGAAEIIDGDCNDPTTIRRVRSLIDPSALSLCFIDMLGIEVAFETVRQVTTDLRMDVLITFQVNDLTRNLHSAVKSGSERHDRFFGTTEWLRVVKDHEAGRGTSSDVASALTDFYCARLSTIGYRHVAQLHRLMRNTMNAPLYRLVLAAKHELGATFFRKISRIEYDGQRNLFG
jgi:three-Cys-motif partner protein